MINNGPGLKKKKLSFKTQYIYNAILLLILTLGVAYSFVFFVHNEAGTTANFTSSLVTIDVSEEGTISLTDAKPVKDEDGLNGVSKVIKVTNTSSIDTLLKISLTPDNSNTINTQNIRYGLYIDGTLEKIDTVGPDDIIYDGLLLAGENVEYEIYLWIDYYYTDSGTSFNGTFNVETDRAIMTIADYTSKLVGKDKGIYAINSSGAVSTDGTDIREYRYSGLDVDNYVWFNCQNGYTSGSENCELWRIVGIFDVKASDNSNNYQRVKLVRESLLDSQKFGSNNTYSGSSVDTYLNGDYYNSLTDSAKNMIIEGEWNVGSSVLTNTLNASLTSEQTGKVYKKVGLLSASDLGYATSTSNYTKALNNTDLYTNSWLRGSSYYTLTPITSSTTTVIGDNGSSITSLEVATATGIKPSVYLMPNVYVKSGNGSIDKPYEITYIDEVEHYGNIKVLGYVTYDVNDNKEVTAPARQAIYADGSTVVKYNLNDTSKYEFKGWATSSSDEVVYKKGDKITETSDVTLYAVWDSKTLVDKITSTMSLTTASDGTRYVYGEVDNNYLWYSGKLWRIVAINNDGSVKLATNGNMTAISWDTSSSNTNYGTSQVHNWLNNEFLPTLYDADKLLTSATWDYTAYAEATATKVTPTATVTNEKVGLLTIYDYYNVRNGSDINFLANGYYWCTLSQQTVNSKVWCVYAGVANYNDSPTRSNGVRPAVNLIANINVTGGTGLINDPYTIEGDKVTGTSSELLNNRVSGEYINFNGVKYRIVSIENGLTKVTMADYEHNLNSLETAGVKYGSDNNQYIFDPTSGVGLYLEEWYQADSSSTTYAKDYINESYKKMIATSDDDNVIWYTGPTSGVGYDYTLAKTGTPVSATIGLGRYGEMFSSHFRLDGVYVASLYQWLLTIRYSGAIYYINNNGAANINTPTTYLRLRPLFYLKSDVKITGGTGMPHDPYVITIN